jgi:cardiolipin synthase
MLQMDIEASKYKDRFLTIPNIISLLRILLIPVFVILILNHRALAAFVVFFVASATDFLDGLIARATRQVSRWGGILDPAGDKLLMSSSYILLTIPSLGYINVLPLWLTLSVFGRDVLLVIGSFVFFKLTGEKDVHVTYLGKLSTASQMGVLILVLLFNWLRISPDRLVWVYYFTVFLTVLSFLHYVWLGFYLLKQKKQAA